MSFADKEILHCLVKGLVDEDIRKQVLGVVEEMDLENTVKYVEAKESGKKAGDYLDSGEADVNKMTGYKQVQREQQLAGRTKPDVLVDEARCKYCGKKGHGAAPVYNKKKEECPAFDKKCNTCGVVGHFSRTKSCKKSSVKVEKVVVQHEKDTKSQVGVKAVAAIRDIHGKVVKLSVSKPIPHMMEVQGKLVVAMPRAHPGVRVQVEVDVSMYKECGLQLKMGKSSMTKEGKLLQVPKVELLCDTGAQVDCVSRRKLRSLGLVESQLLQPAVSIGCANDTSAEVLGVFFGKVLAVEGDKRVQVKVMFYVLKHGGNILSRHTCEKLGLISPDFPKIGEHLEDDFEQVGVEVNGMEGSDAIYQEDGECDPDSRLPCRCPRRSFVDPPDEIPFSPCEANREKLEDWIKDYYASCAFSTCKRQDMPCTEGPPMKIHTDPDAVPFVVHKPVPVPLHYRAEVKANIDADVKRGVLQKVPPGVPDTWCTRLVITPKKDGRPRRTVDLAVLTKAGVRETHHTRSPFKVVCSVPRGMLKTTLDCTDGYHGIPLAEEDMHKTTFITEWGRYSYRRAPQGYGSSNDGYTIRTDDILASVPGKPEENDYEKIVDDVIQWSEDIETAFHRVCAMLSHCSKAGMVFSPSKFVFAAIEVEYAGFLVGSDSIGPTPKYIQSILDFPTPKNISNIRSWYGLINQVAFAFSKGVVMAPFRELLKPAVKFEWTSLLDKAFRDSKLEIVRLVKDGVKMFDMGLVTCLSTDFCQSGLGWILQQKVCQCRMVSPHCCESGWRLVLAGGRFTIPAETRYSPTEGEALAVAVGLESSRYYTLGCPRLYVATDHKPLLGILNDRALDTIFNPRLVKIKERTLGWQFDIVYVPVERQAAADALSRKRSMGMLACLSIDAGDQDDMEKSLSEAMAAQLMEVSVSGGEAGGMKLLVGLLSVDAQPMVMTWSNLQDATKEDKVLTKLMEEIQRGIPDSSNSMLAELRQFHKYRHGLMVMDGVVCYKSRAVIPVSLQQRVLETLHAAHQGVTGMVNRAEQSVFWPSITTDIARVRAVCRTCVRNAPSQPAGMPVPPPSPSYPFQMVAADYCHMNGVNYLVIGDRYSGWLSVLYVGRGDFDAEQLIEVLRDYFVTFGVVEEIASDLGPQFRSSKFEKFLQQYGVHHRRSSAYFPHSNSRAEIAVKSGKRILRDNVSPEGKVNTDRFLRAMLQYRNTPQPDTRMSPAQVVYGRHMRDFIPVVNDKYEPKQEWGMIREYRERALARRLDRDGARLEEHTKKLGPVPVGGAVAVQNQTGRFPKKWDKTGVVVENKDHDKVCVRLDGSRRLTTRNRRFVRRIVSTRDLPMQETPDRVHMLPEVGLSLPGEGDGTLHLDDAGHDGPPEDPDAVVVEQPAIPDLPVAEWVHDAVLDHPDETNAIETEVVEPSNVRPKRVRQQNMKYDPEVYDLSMVTDTKRGCVMKMSGVHVMQKRK